MVTRAVVSAILFMPTDALPDSDTDALRTLHVELSDVHKRVAKWDAAYEDDACTLSEWRSKKAPLRKRADAIEANIAQIKQRNAQAALLSESRSALWSTTAPSLTDAAKVKQEIRQRFDALTLEQRRALVRGLLGVTVNSGRGNRRVAMVHKVAVSLNGNEVDESPAAAS